MSKRNPNLAKLHSSYLFPEIQRRKQAFLQEHPEVSLIDLSIGDTSQPLVPAVVESLIQGASRLGTAEGYEGYGPSWGHSALREKVAEKIYKEKIDPSSIFLNDGAKCDLARLQHLFDQGVRVAVQDPAYPVYVDDTVLMGRTGEFLEQMQQYEGIVYLPCRQDNHFFPDLAPLEGVDLIYFCSPNNPTGAVATHDQLRALVHRAKEVQALILFDTAYSPFIQDPTLPTSIYEIEGADEVAIEIGSFSKLAGFTGLRLGWTVVPPKLRFKGGEAVQPDWIRLTQTLFGGPSNLVQWGAEGLFTDAGAAETESLVTYYRRNATLLKNALKQIGWSVYGGKHAPYLWVPTPGRSSWEAFDHFLKEAHVVCTPGCGFGPSGEGFVRFSAMGHHRDMLEAVHRLERVFSLAE